MAPPSTVEGLCGSARRRTYVVPRPEGTFFGSTGRSIEPCNNSSPWINIRRATIATAIGVAVFLMAIGSLPGMTPTETSSPSRQPLQHSDQPDWRNGIAGCTGAADVGYSYKEGGAATKVLHFTHHSNRRRTMARAQGQTGADEAGKGDVPNLDEVVRWMWDLKLAENVLWFTVSELDTRRDVGKDSGWECVFAANIGRSKPFPPPEPVEVPWNASKFNFYRADPLEFMFEYTPSFDLIPEVSSEPAQAPPPVEPAAGALESSDGDVGTGGSGLRGEGAVLRQAIDQSGVQVRGDYERVPEGMGQQPSPSAYFGEKSADLSSVDCKEISGSSPPRHAVLVNVRPVGPVSVLLMPGYPRALHQRATPEALAVAMDFSEALMSSPGFRLGFNSGGSSASVNHLHFQCWNFNAGPGGLPVEVANTIYEGTLPLAAYASSTTDYGVSASLDTEPGRGSETGLDVHSLDDRYPLRGLVYYTLGKDLLAAGAAIGKCIDFLVQEEIPHTMLFSQGRAFLLPRQPLIKPPFAAVIGFPEVSGEVIITSEEDFRVVTADAVFRFWRESITVDVETFEKIRRECLSP